MSAASLLQLGYLAFQVSDLAAWESFATKVLGLLVANRWPDGGLSLRMDGHEQRFFLFPGPKDDLMAVGWQVEDKDALSAVLTRLRGAGVAVKLGSAEELNTRKVQGLITFADPAAIPIEVFFGPALAPASEQPFDSPVVRSGFVADALGLGHVVLNAENLEESQLFYTRLLGFRLSDRITADVYGYKADVIFLHTNARHHSLALAAHQRKRIHHFLIEARCFDEVGLAFDRTLAARLKICQTLGRHPNDRMFSFYARTPSGFQFEFGFGGQTIDEATWQPVTYDFISEWGHHPMALFTEGQR
jgi:2,3-dihydroxybiphenyl 1,2-dioxygenase